MPVSSVQNFYKEVVTTPWTTGTGNFYVSTKPSVSAGFLVISPNSESLREIVQFTATGTDSGGDYVTVSYRGLGGTTEQAHATNEKVYMNITAQHIEEIKQAIADINQAGAENATTTSKGIVRLTATSDVTIGNPTITIASPGVVTMASHGLTENDEIKFTTTGALPTGIVSGTRYFVIATDLTANTFKFSATFGGTAVNTSGSQSGTHTLTRTTPMATSVNDPKLPSTDQKAAMAGGGAFGNPSTTNKFTTDDYFDDTTNFIRNDVPLAYIPLPTFQQDLFLSTADAIAAGHEGISGSNTDGSVLFIGVQGNSNLYRFERDAVTGGYYQTHAVNPTLSFKALGSIVVLGSYIYVFADDATNIVCSRFLAADLTGEQVMTVPTVASTSGVIAWTDGTDVYLASANSATTSRRWTLSGTTFSAASTATISTFFSSADTLSSFWDGTNAYVVKGTTTQAQVIKLDTITATSQTATTTKIPAISDYRIFLGACNVDTRMYIGAAYPIYDETGAINSAIRLFPITKP